MKNYQKKYLKYKAKYLELQNQLGGTVKDKQNVLEAEEQQKKQAEEQQIKQEEKRRTEEQQIKQEEKRRTEEQQIKQEETLNILLEEQQIKQESEENDKVIKYVKETAFEINPIYNSPEILSEYEPASIFYGLNISMELGDITTIFDEYGYIQIRPYQGEKVLVIGCGNRRIDAGNLYHKKNTEERINYKRNYDLDHLHLNQFTIDLTLVANPSIISNFGPDSRYYTIPDHSFTLIYCEGGAPVNNDREISRLLDNKTTSFYIIVENGDYMVHSFYKDGEFIKLINLENE